MLMRIIDPRHAKNGITSKINSIAIILSGCFVLTKHFDIMTPQT